MSAIPTGLGPPQMPLAHQSSMQKIKNKRLHQTPSTSKTPQLSSTQVHAIDDEVCASASRQTQLKNVFCCRRQPEPTSSASFGPCLPLHPSSLRTQMQQGRVSIVLHRKKDRQSEGNRLARGNRQAQQTEK